MFSIYGGYVPFLIGRVWCVVRSKCGVVRFLPSHPKVLSLPLGVVGETAPSPSPSVLEILGLLQNAEKLFWSDLALIARRGHVFQVREAALSLALIRTFQGSLGKGGVDGPVMASCLLGTFGIRDIRQGGLRKYRWFFRCHTREGDAGSNPIEVPGHLPR